MAPIGTRTIFLVYLMSATRLAEVYGIHHEISLFAVTTVCQFHAHLILLNSDIQINHSPRILFLGFFGPEYLRHACKHYIRWKEEERLPSIFIVSSITDLEVCKDVNRFMVMIWFPWHLLFMIVFFCLAWKYRHVDFENLEQIDERESEAISTSSSKVTV
jgi:hypothetical protein